MAAVDAVPFARGRGAPRVRAALEHVTGIAWIGLVSGLALGVLARVLIWVSFLLRPPTEGLLTEGGATIGQMSAEGTVGVLLFAGVLVGLGAACAYLVTEPWLQRLRFLPFVVGHPALLFDVHFARPAILAIPLYALAALCTLGWWQRKAVGAAPARWLVRTGTVATGAVIVLGLGQILRVAARLL